MIQRIQSIYWMLAILCMLVLLTTPLVQFTLLLTTGQVQIHTLYTYGLSLTAALPEAWSALPLWTVQLLMGMDILAIVLALIAIFKYKNRQTQIRLTWFALLLQCCFILYLIVLTYYFQSLSEGIGTVPTLYLLLPLVSIIFLILARNAVCRDEAKIKAANRLR